jgi:lipoyl(octanoyl) transferase
MSRKIETITLPGLTPYAEAMHFQDARRCAVEAGGAPSALFLLEHSPVITLGRRWRPEHLLLTRDEFAARGIEVHETDRGGDVTYHGPGQMVAYPVLDLNQWQPSIQWYLRSLEDVLIRQLASYGLQAERMPGFTGVWVGGAKVAAIGIGTHRWVTFHGVALNVNPKMDHFQLIVPCGITDKPVTTLAALLGKPPTMHQAMADFDREFRKCFHE